MGEGCSIDRILKDSGWLWCEQVGRPVAVGSDKGPEDYLGESETCRM